ncbi:8949_t:CDS:10 [Funneliformis geosporum]|uniref:16219_t:CDS:1 n=1 Tax=Funneliformis geosporum TaxID=1117311 RepID=A0A9W4SJL8_9GLOM|nr:8949_t:CDS:10 [Funneliformis geosporum]CAI2171811.1 16219_t:CDS:10 [Funneliformis geosporum]
MNSNNDTSKKLQQNQKKIDDFNNDIDEIPYLSPIPPITTNNQDESFVGNNSGILYKDIILPDTGSNISSFTPRRESFALSDSESNRPSTPSLLIPSNIRRRAFSTSSRPKDRYSMHELGSKIDDNSLTRKFLSPTRHSMAFDNRFGINNTIVGKNSLEDREWNIDRERIGNAGKGFGNLINDESGKGSIADLIADVKDEDAVELALITQRNADQKNRIHLTEMDIEKYNTRKEETTLSNSRMCKQFLGNKYHVLFKIINNNGIYNPLQIIKNRKIDIESEGSVHSKRSSDKSRGSSNRLISNRMKLRRSLLSHKETRIWDVSHMEAIKDYEQINKFDQVHLNKLMSRNNGYEINSEVGVNFNNQVASEPDENKKRLRLSQIFIPPTTQEMQAMSSQGNIRSNSEQSKKTTHYRALSMNNIAAAPQGKEESHGKSKRWSIHLFKRKDKKHKNEPSSSNVGIIQEAPDYSLTSQMKSKSSSDSSSGDQTYRNSMEDGRFSSEKSKDPLQQEDETDKTYDEEIYYNSGVKREKFMSKLSGDKQNDRFLIDDWSDIAQNRCDSEDTDNSNHSSTIHSVDLESDVVVNDAIDSSRRNTGGYLNVEDHYGKFLGDEQLVDNRSSSENKTAEDSTESEVEYDEEFVGETVLVNLDILPQELVDLVAEQDIVVCNTKNGNFVELDVGLNELFKFRKLIGCGVDLLDLQISLVYDDPEDSRSLNHQDADKVIKEYDERIEETTKFLEDNKVLLAERDDVINKYNYISNKSCTFELFDIPFVLSPISNIQTFTFDNNNRLNSSPSRSIMAECKMNIDEGIELLSDRLVKIENTMNKLVKQHLKILEDEIHLLIAEKGKSPWIDVFYLMMSYVIAGIMFMFWFIVACGKLSKKISLFPRRMWKSVRRNIA